MRYWRAGNNVVQGIYFYFIDLFYFILISASPAEFTWAGFDELKHLQRQRMSRDGGGSRNSMSAPSLSSHSISRAGKVPDPHPWVPTAPSPAKAAAGG